MKPPPLLLGAALLFWGWQTGFLIPGALMAALLEGARLIKVRWELSDEDFSRLWAFCSVLLLAALVFSFNTYVGLSNFTGRGRNPILFPQNGAGQAGARTAIALFRWLPIIFFLFVAAQSYNSNEQIPRSTLLRILRWRWRKADKRASPEFPTRGVNVGYPYFALTLFAASNHAGENSRYFFWGLSLLTAWALWPQRSRRFATLIWFGTFTLVIALGFVGQSGLGQLQSFLGGLNPQWLSPTWGRRGTDPIQSRTWLGEIGKLKQSGTIIIRLQPEIGAAPPLLREASYRTYRLQTWYSGSELQNGAFPGRRRKWRGMLQRTNATALPFFRPWFRRNEFEPLMPQTNGTTWVLLANKTNTSRVQIACYLEGRTQEAEPRGMLPLPTGCSRLDRLPAFGLRKNDLGAIYAVGPGLVMFDACYGPGDTIDSPPGTNEDLDVPNDERPALEKVAAELGVEEKGRDEVLRAVQRFFEDRFEYRIWQEPPKDSDTKETPLSRFLLQTHSGHCEYFATATVLLLRELHIQARYAVGYAVQETSGDGYIVRQRDAHAWCLVWNDRTRTWEDFDTTPGSWVNAESRRASPWQRLLDAWSWTGFELAKFRWGQSPLRQYLPILLVPVLALLLYRILFRRGRTRARRPAADTQPPVAWPGRDSEFYLVERKLAEGGVLRQPNETLSHWLRRAAMDPAVAGVNGPLRTLLQLHYRYRFDPRSLGPTDREELKRGTHRVLETLNRQN